MIYEVVVSRSMDKIPILKTQFSIPCTERSRVQGTAVVKRSVLENQTTEVAVSCNDVVSFFFLTEVVTVVQGFNFSSKVDLSHSKF
jgi:hypothetical protein